MPISLNGTTGYIGPDGSAASPAIQGGDANTGMFFPAADTIAFAEGGVEVGRFDSSGNFLFNSGYGSAAVAYGCRAWVNFNGTGTVAIRASGNVSSITDNGTGDYTVNFTTAMVDANFAATGSAGGVAGANPRILGINNRTTSAVRVSAGQSTLQDESEVSVAIFR